MKHLVIVLLACALQAGGQTAVGVQTHGGVSWFSMDKHSPLYNSSWDPITVEYKGDKLLGLGVHGTWAVYPKIGLEGTLRYNWAEAGIYSEKPVPPGHERYRHINQRNWSYSYMLGIWFDPFKNTRVQLASGIMQVVETRYRSSNNFNSITVTDPFRKKVSFCSALVTYYFPFGNQHAFVGVSVEGDAFFHNQRKEMYLDYAGHAYIPVRYHWASIHLGMNLWEKI